MATATAAGLLAILSALAVDAQESLCNRTVSAPLESEARSAIEKHDYQAAAKLFDQALHACPEKRSILLEIAQLQMSARNFEAAIGAAKNYLEGDPASAPAHVL